MPDVFNNSELGGLTKIDPATDASLSTGFVNQVLVAQAIARRSEYVFPELDGAGSQNFGRQPVRITWLLTYLATNATNRLAFEAKIEAYLKTAQRFQLESARGDVWPYCELLRFDRGEVDQLAGGGELVASARIEFLNMQP